MKKYDDLVKVWQIIRLCDQSNGDILFPVQDSSPIVDWGSHSCEIPAFCSSFGNVCLNGGVVAGQYDFP